VEVRRFGESRRKRVTIDVDERLRGIHIHFDAVHLRLVLENLIRNALAATGEVSFQTIDTAEGEKYREMVSFNLNKLDTRDKRVSIHLVDNGIGLRDVDARKLYREKGFTRRPGGQGFGCQIITRFLAVNGGSVSLVKTKFGMNGEGTTQEIAFPLAKVLTP
jgi:nitrogen fixation/metabolism regulation signal transduction histidine kinase